MAQAVSLVSSLPLYPAVVIKHNNKSKLLAWQVLDHHPWSLAEEVLLVWPEGLISFSVSLESMACRPANEGCSRNWDGEGVKHNLLTNYGTMYWCVGLSALDSLGLQLVVLMLLGGWGAFEALHSSGTKRAFYQSFCGHVYNLKLPHHSDIQKCNCP